MKRKRLRLGLLAASVMIAACGGKILPGSTNDEQLVVGTACADDSDCSRAGGDTSLVCFTSAYAEALPNGYCSKNCAHADDCSGPPTSVACGKRTRDAHDMYAAYCFAVCDPQAAVPQCRAGYQCSPFVTEEGESAFGCSVVGG